MIMRYALAACMTAAFVAPSLAANPTGGFFVHLNQQNTTTAGFSDSDRSVTFYDADDISGGTPSPLFSVHIPGEIVGAGSYNGEEVDAIATDPNTGDVYVLAFDSGTVGNVEPADTFSSADSDGDLDLYRINFQTVYDHWSSNFEGTSVVAGTTAGVGGTAPNIPAGAAAGGFDDYVTYSSIAQQELFPGNGFHFDPVNTGHSNAFTLAGSVEKIGEVKRNNGGNFFDFSLEFVDSDTLVMIDDSSAPTATDTAATDHEYRIISRVSTSPGAATGAADHGDGGFNNGTTESWESTRIGLVNQDFAAGVPTGHSEVESMAYHHDIVSGRRGFWVTESDSSATTRGDDIAFFDIDTNSYVEHLVGGGPTFPTSFALDDDPFVNSSLNDGQADHIFVDEDTGDLIIIESGFGDAGIATVGADHEPSVIRREVLSYDNGGRIQFGAWGMKQITTPGKDPGDTFLERGHWAAYDSDGDKVYFINPGGPGETPSFQADIMVLDVNTGITTTYLNTDDSVALFFGDSFGDVADFFFLDDAPIPGDVNCDGVVDLLDLDILGTNFGLNGVGFKGGDLNEDGVVDLLDLDILGTNFGNMAPSASVPEPTALVLAGLAACGLIRRRV